MSDITGGATSKSALSKAVSRSGEKTRSGTGSSRHRWIRGEAKVDMEKLPAGSLGQPVADSDDCDHHGDQMFGAAISCAANLASENPIGFLVSAGTLVYYGMQCDEHISSPGSSNGTPAPWQQGYSTDANGKCTEVSPPNGACR